MLRADALPEVAAYLFWETGCGFGGLSVELQPDAWLLHYWFLLRQGGWLDLHRSWLRSGPPPPSITSALHAADWYEREAEDLFGVSFAGHPRLGDFVLHDQAWPEGLAPMRSEFTLGSPPARHQGQRDWRPLLVAEEPGAFALPLGPVYEGGIGESVHFLIETVGEEVIRVVPRLFYHYRAIEKSAEGRSAAEGLLLAERFAGTSAFAHGWAYCRAVELLAGAEVPERAQQLRVAWAELERMRHHAGHIAWICRSTALNVAEAQAAMIEEDLLRASGAASGHRYLWGLLAPGGLRRDPTAAEIQALLTATGRAQGQLRQLERRLRYSSSFLDRLEECGVVTPEQAREFDLAGPVGRASGLRQDLRRELPYGGYAAHPPAAALESEGDGYARLRVLFREAEISAALIEGAMKDLAPGSIAVPCPPRAGAALGWVEAPSGAALHWLRLDAEGRIRRYHVLTASFRNWLGFHVAAETFAFQDFPIILATFGLSATECDR
ncbi:MAG: NADH-quinone oxidoreductase subunit C [Terriglobales bacterium]